MNDKIESLTDRNKAGGQRLLKSLGVTSEDELAKYWMNADLQPANRAKACVAAGLLGIRSAAPVMLKLIGNSTPEIAWGAANGLALLKYRPAIRPLMKVVENSRHEATRNAAIHALGALNSRSSESLLCRVLVDQKRPEATRTFAACALMCPHDPKRTAKFLIRALDDPSASVRWQSLSALGSMGATDAASAIRRLLSDKSVVSGLLTREAMVSWAARKALRDLGSGKR